MRNLWLVAGFTLREATRKRAVLALAAVGVGVLLLFIPGARQLWKEAGQAGSFGQSFIWAVTRVVMGMLNLLGGVAAMFLAGGGLSVEIEQGSLYLLIPRGASRHQVYLGKLLAYSLLAGLFSFTLAMGMGLIHLFVGGTWPPGWHWILLFYWIPSVLLVALALWLSSRFSTMVASLITLGAFLVAQIGGLLEAVPTAFMKNTAIVISLIAPTDAVYGYMIARWNDALGPDFPLLQNFGQLPSSHPSIWMMVWTAGWFLVVVAAGMHSFRTRDL